MHEIDKSSHYDSHKECRNRDFESRLKNTYGMKSLNDMNRIHNNKVNNTSGWNLLHAILNSSKRTKNMNIHYYPILHVCMNTSRGKAKFKEF